jgi:Fe2+ or Zn2+ uptake regulation protein
MTYDTGFQIQCPECGFLTDSYQIKYFGRCKDCQEKNKENKKEK